MIECWSGVFFFWFAFQYIMVIAVEKFALNLSVSFGAKHKWCREIAAKYGTIVPLSKYKVRDYLYL